MAKYRILIAEDHREVSRLLRTSLETLGHDMEVVESPSGEEAILDASRHRVDVLVSDYRLPGITGIELMQKIRHFNHNTKVILITGLSDPKVRKEVAEAGADAFFIKPVPIADFLDSIERHLGLVETLLPPEPVASEEGEAHPTLSDLLVGLRQELRARAVLLLNDRGRILARAGDLPDTSFEISLTASLMAIYNAGRKVLSLIGQKDPSDWHVFAGREYDLVFAPVGFKYAILAAGDDLVTERKVLETVAIISTSRQVLEKALAAMGVDPNGKAVGEEQGPVQPNKVEPESNGDRDLEPLLKHTKKKLKKDEVDAFWDQAVDGQRNVPPKPNVITSDQARQLGLAPLDDSSEAEKS